MTFGRYRRWPWLPGMVAWLCLPLICHATAVFTPEEQQWIREHPVVRFAADTRTAPVEYAQGGQYRGLVADFLNAVARQSGLRFELVPTENWDQAQQYFLDHKIDLFPNATPLRMNRVVGDQLAFTSPYFSSPLIIVTRADQPVVLNPTQMDGKKVVIRAGSAVEQEFHQRFPDITPVHTARMDQGLELVLRGDAYAMVGSEAALLPLLRRQYTGRLGVSGLMADMPLVNAMAVRKEDALLLSIITKSLGALSAHDTDVIYERWASSVDYGKPSLESLLYYRRTELLLLVLGVTLLAWFAWRARVAQRRAQASESAKSRFLAVMSHEIRTPMNAILASIEMLQQSLGRERDRKLAHTAATAAEALLALLDDVLDLSKLDAHRLQLELVPVDIGHQVQKAVEVARVKAQDKAIPIHVRMENPGHHYVTVDPTRLRQVLMNLLGNAVKFTYEGHIDVDVNIDNAGQGAGFLTVSVADTGIGIDKQQQKRIFDAYHQADTSTTRKYGGTGLGLTICRELVTLMGGTIELHSEEGKGTTVRFILPVRLTAPPSEATLRDAPPLAEHARPVASGKVLIVEDHPQNRFILSEQMHALGLQSVLAADGKAALQALTQDDTIELVLMDCHMPEMDGYEATRRVRAREAELGLARVPIIAISAATDAAHLERCVAAGMDGVLKKPLRIDELRGMLGLWLGTAPSVGKSSTPSPPKDPLQVVDLHALYRQSVEEDEAALDSSLADGDRERVIHHAHRLKGAGMMVGASVLAEHAQAIEMAARGGQSLDSLQGEWDALQQAIASWLAVKGSSE
ncbi:ATP-binding protein [Dyella sp.]|uniref:ATP-binding protein n=1 Tax=Dyella sp. TaxID=1869338 RepID=UPI002ED3DE8F